MHDRYFRKAKDEGYAARSAYKLLEIQEKRRLIRPGDRVLDLGCAPGSWLQALGKILGPRGRALGVDLQPVTVDFPARFRAIVADANTLRKEDLGEDSIAPFDVILSDMAPNTTGHGDDFLSARLCERVLELCGEFLRPGGNLCMKILEGEPTPEVIRHARQVFESAGTTKPQASREVSREIFIWGTGYRGRG